MPLLREEKEFFSSNPATCCRQVQADPTVLFMKRDERSDGDAGQVLTAAQAEQDGRPFGVQLGERLQQVREEKEATREDIARKARFFGLPWHRPTVGQIEQGKRGVSAPELLVLPLIYGTPLRDLLPGEGAVTWLTEETAVRGDALRHWLDEEPEEPALPGPWHFKGATRLAGMIAQARERLSEAMPWGAKAGFVASPDEAETKAAKRLNTTPEYVAYTARELWGRGLAEERDARLAERPDAPATPRAAQAARGHITRTLLDEMEPVIREHEKRRDKPRPRYKVVETEAGVHMVREAGEADG
jgi:transcriptional regulator with XRE-family HTH domain